MENIRSRRVFLVGLVGGLAGACATTIPTGEPGALEVADYRLGPGDELRITVFGEDDLSGEYVVNPQGRITFPLVGEVDAGGKTFAELNTALTEALQRDYLRQPNIAIDVVNYRPFYILGEVRTPGTYAYSANLTVLNAVATAQGFTYRADERQVFIKHSWENVERVYPLTTTTPVQPGDTIRIAQRIF